MGDALIGKGSKAFVSLHFTIEDWELQKYAPHETAAYYSRSLSLSSLATLRTQRVNAEVKLLYLGFSRGELPGEVTEESNVMHLFHLVSHRLFDSITHSL